MPAIDRPRFILALPYDPNALKTRNKARMAVTP